MDAGEWRPSLARVRQGGVRSCVALVSRDVRGGRVLRLADGSRVAVSSMLCDSSGVHVQPDLADGVVAKCDAMRE
jgi:hypothetical protein